MTMRVAFFSFLLLLTFPSLAQAQLSAPTNLTATPDDVGGATVNLVWGNSTGDGIEIYRRIGYSGAFTLITTTAAGATAASDPGRARNVSYQYKARAKSNDGPTFSAYSNVTFATIVPSPRGSLVTDGLAHTPTLFPCMATLAAGGYCYDELTGVKIIRATDPNTEAGASFSTVYSYWSVLNSNNTRLLAQSSQDSRLRTITFTPGYAMGPLQIAVPAPDGNTCVMVGATWSTTISNLLYCQVSAGYKIYSYDPVAQHYTQLADLSSVLTNGGTSIAQMLMSRDNNRLTATVFNPSFNSVGALAYQLSTNSVLKQIANADLPYPIDETNITQNGRFFAIRLEDPGTSGSVVFRVYDLNATPVTSVNITADSPQNAPGHAAYTTNGQIGYESFHGWIVKRDLSTPATNTTLLTTGFTLGNVNLSTLDANPNWVTISVNSMSNATLNLPFQNTIFQLATDGSGGTKQIVHDHTLEPFPSGNDAYQPRAAISFDGRYVAWTSNMDNPTGRTDIFIADLGSTAARVCSWDTSPACQ